MTLKLCGQLIVIALLGLIAAFGCKSRENKIDTVKENKLFLAELERLYGIYLNGEPSQVREAFADEMRRIEEASWLPPGDKAAQLQVTYMRLFAFHKRMGEEASAEGAWIKLRFWMLRRFELSGVEPREAAREMGAFTPDSVMKQVSAWDERENKGRAPRYLLEATPHEKK